MRRFRLPIIAGLFLLVLVGGYFWTIYHTDAPVASKRIDVMVTGGTSMSPSTWRANHNDRVTVIITSDSDGEVHLHGYDIKWGLTRGVPWTVTFTADITGDFPIEWEETSSHLGDFKVSP